jgi:hypothetical protein
MVDSTLLRAPQAARELGIPTKELLRLIYERKIRYVMVDGIAHVPPEALTEYRAKASLTASRLARPIWAPPSSPIAKPTGRSNGTPATVSCCAADGTTASRRR